MGKLSTGQATGTAYWTPGGGDVVAPTWAQDEFVGPRTPPGKSFLAVGADNFSDYLASTSPDGTTWTAQTIPAALFAVAALWNGAEFLIAGTSDTPGVGPAIATSPDGVTWTGGVLPTIEPIRGIAYNGALWLLVGDNGALLTSPDGITWTVQTSATGVNLTGAATNGALFVVVGISGAIETSPNGVNWTQRTSTTAHHLRAVAYNATDGYFLAVGDTGVMVTSPDGITWTPVVATSFTTHITAVAWNGSLWVACGQSGNLSTSPDAVTWTTQTSGTANFLISVGWNGITWLAGNNGGVGAATIISPDGVTWTPQAANPWNGQFTAIEAGPTISLGGYVLSATPIVNSVSVFLQGVRLSQGVYSIDYANQRLYIDVPVGSTDRVIAQYEIT